MLKTKKYNQELDRRLMEAAAALRMSPGFPVIEQYLKDVLDETKDALVVNRSELVPTLQGRAQMLIEVIELLQRKP